MMKLFLFLMMTLSFAAKAEFIIQPSFDKIPAILEEGLIDFNLPGLKITNNFQGPIEIKSLTVTLLASDQEISYKKLKPPLLMENITSSFQFLNSKQGKRLQTLFFGPDFLGNSIFSENLQLGAGESTLIRNIRESIKTSLKVNQVSISVEIIENGKQKEFSRVIGLFYPKLRNTYKFPLRGTWVVTSNWDDPYSHRKATFTHFSHDYYQLNQKGTPYRKKNPAKNEDVICYGSPVYSALEGEVVEVVDGISDNKLGERQTESSAASVETKFGKIAIIAGNYVLIKHVNGESSFYAHLKPGSIKVKPGKKVKSQQQIAKIGNGGNSNGAHLHFQIFDGENLKGFRALPLKFENLLDEDGRRWAVTSPNRSVVHTD